MKRSITALFFAVILIFLQSAAVNTYAEEFSDTDLQLPVMESGDFEDDLTVEACYYDTAADMTYNFSVPYSDSFFERDSDVFYMDLAQASFGLNISAFRAVEDESIARDQNAREFISKIGFENFESFWYDQEPTEDSISNIIAEKKIGDETIIAFACNGVDYGDEWLSNLTLGYGTEHEGFSAAADICQERLMDYIESHEITGTVKLWITGHSRAAAVGNCLVGHLIESGIFSDVYGYFFATPNNTKEPVSYPNIFNIIGQNDAVPWIPLASWGYGHNGIDLYLPAQESNTSYTDSFAAANEVYSELRGESFHNNPELNRQLYVIEEFVAVIFPTAEEFTSVLQPQLLSLFDDETNLLSLLKEALDNIDDFTADQQQAVDALTEYLDSVIYQYISGNYSQVSDGSWSAESPLAQNLFYEHMEFVYGSWLFSTKDPSDLFVDSTTTMYLVIKGDLDLEIWDGAGIVQSVSSGNEEIVYEPGSENRAAAAEYIELYASNHDGTAIISVPSDSEYTIKLYANSNEDITLFSDTYSYQSRTDASDIILFRAGEGEGFVLSDLFEEDGMKIQTESGGDVVLLKQTMPPGISSLIAREKMISGSFTVEQVLYAITFFLLMPVILMIIALLIFLIGRRRRKEKAKIAVTVCFGILAIVLAAGAVIFRLLLPNMWQVTASYAALAAGFAVLCLVRIIRKIRLKKLQQVKTVY